MVVSNDFGTVTTQPTTIDVNGTPTTHTVPSANNLEMIFCPPGTFTMGSPTTEADRQTDETQYQVTLTNGFYLGKYEVTRAQYETVMTGNSEGLNAKPSQWSYNNSRPVQKVSWNDIQVFLSRLNDMEEAAGRLPAGWKYVLPTEAQWEYACRAGTTTVYSWGNDINSTRANYNWDGGQADGNDFKQTVMWVSTWPTRGAFLICTEMCGNGSATGRGTILPVLRSILRVRHPARNAFTVEAWTDDGTSLRSSKRANYFATSSRPYNLGFRLAFHAMPADTANPELELFGGFNINREAGQAWVEPGVEAHDARDGNITDQIVVTGSMDMNRTGTYLLTYTVQDGAWSCHRNLDGQPHRGLECYRCNGHDLVSAWHFYYWQSDDGGR